MEILSEYIRSINCKLKELVCHHAAIGDCEADMLFDAIKVKGCIKQKGCTGGRKDTEKERNETFTYTTRI